MTEHFVLKVPAGLDPAAAAPLLCAGITLYSPLRRYGGAGPGTRVAIIGMGGLGHIGVKIAAALGAEVTVLGHSLSKKDDGLRFGAVDYRATSDPAVFKELRSRFDLILNTVSVNLDMDRYLSLLRLNGALVELGLPEHPLTLRAFSLGANNRALAGSNVGGIGGNPGDAGLLRGARYRRGDRTDRRRADQRRLRSGGRERGALPLRHRRCDDLRLRTGRCQNWSPSCSRSWARVLVSRRDTCIWETPDPVGDLRLRHVPEEPEQHHRAFTFGQGLQQRAQRFVVLDLGQAESYSPSVSARVTPCPPESVWALRSTDTVW